MGRHGLTDKSVDLHSRRQGTGTQIPVEDKLCENPYAYAPTPFAQTFTPIKTFSKVGHGRRTKMDKAISMIWAVFPTFMKSTP